MKLAVFAGIVPAALLVVSAQADAQIAFTKDSTTASFHGGTAKDAATGLYYRLDNYFNGAVTQYTSESGFETGTGGSTITIGNHAGTYFAAQGGFLYGNSDTSGFNPGTVSKWSLTTGALVGSASFTGFGGRNGPDSFDWGGGSVMNVLNDNGTLYLISGNGVSSSYATSFARLNSDLTISNSFQLNMLGANGNSDLGWGFVAGGKFFGSKDFNNSGSLDYAIDLTTGTRSTISLLLTGLGTGSYITNASYVSSTDTLYVWNAQGLYEASGIARTLNLTAVPEPSTWAMMMLGFGGLAYTMRRKQRVTGRIRFA